MIKKIFKYLLVGFLGLFCLGVVISIIDPNSKKASTAHEVSSTDPDSLKDKARPNLPNDQVEFINIIESFSDSYSAGENDFKKGAERTKRKAKLCSSFRTRKISNWYGTVKSLSSNNTGYGILNISIAPYINLATTNNEFSDNLSEIHTLIHPEDPVFSDLGNIKEGQTVKFSGVFIPDTTDCFLVQAITQNGAMTDPEFEVKFQSVKPVD